MQQSMRPVIVASVALLLVCSTHVAATTATGEAEADAIIRKLNADSKHAQFGRSIFSHLSSSEWQQRQRRSGLIITDDTSDDNKDQNLMAAVLPPLQAPPVTPLRAQNIHPQYFSTEQVNQAAAGSIDWQLNTTNPMRLGAVTRVKNQGECGACWAFATIGALEGQVSISGGPHHLAALSEQYVLDCMSISSGCGGGSPQAAALRLTQSAVPLEQGYEFLSYDNSSHACSFTGNTFAIASEALVPTKSNNQDTEDVMAAYVTFIGPLSVSLMTGIPAWQHYTGGVMDVCPTNVAPNQLDHAALIVGLGVDEAGMKYWRIKNSWSPMWGEQGYMRLQRGVRACGVNLFPVGVKI